MEDLSCIEFFLNSRSDEETLALHGYSFAPPLQWIRCARSGSDGYIPSPCRRDFVAMQDVSFAMEAAHGAQNSGV